MTSSVMVRGAKFVLFKQNLTICFALLLCQAALGHSEWNGVASSEPEAVSCSARIQEFQECRLKQPKSYQWLCQVTTGT